MTDLKRFSASAIPSELRQPAWNEILTRIGLAGSPIGLTNKDDNGHVALGVSVRNSVFIHLSAGAQTLTPLTGQPGHSTPGAVLVLGLLSGAARVLDAEQPVRLGSGDIMLLDPTQPWRLEMQSDFRAVLIRLESANFLLRLVRIGRQQANRISTQQGVGALCISMLQTLSEQLQHLQSNELPALEATLAELLLACLSHKQPNADDAATDVQLAHLRRVCRSIDAQLDDPELHIEQVGQQEGLSARYVQKLFKSSGTTFGEYLKSRRVQHCCIDLANPALSQFSIAQLCYRWGFNDAANFSRTFSQHLGMSPKAYRANPPQDLHEQLQRGCPPTAPSSRSAVKPADDVENDLQRHRRPFQSVLDDHARYALSVLLAPKRVPQAQKVPETTQPAPRQYYLPACLRQDRALGLFQPRYKARADRAFWRHSHHRNPVPARLRRLRADD